MQYGMGFTSRMKTRCALALVVLALFFADGQNLCFAQAENVPVGHSVYTFLKRLEVKGLIEKYHDAVLPLSRNEIAGFLTQLNQHPENLTETEQDYLKDFLSEFQYDITGSTEEFHSMIDSDGSSFGEELSQREKFLYEYADSNVSFFVNGLAVLDTRHISGDALGSEQSTFFQFGGRLRGTLLGKVGYFLQATNAQFWGSRALLQRDPVISQSFALGTLDAKNFDFAEGYVRYDGGIVSAQVGRERVLWGNGYDQKITLSENVRVFDFIRADAQYKSLKYTFLHAWLLGTKTFIPIISPADSSSVSYEPVVADKYFAAHRLEFSFPGVMDIGAQEMVVYSNRAPDLAYLNPLTVIESAQRSREERDNVMWSFDVQTHFIKGVEFQFTALFDDIHLAEFFDNKWYNRYAYQAGVFVTDPFGVSNTSFVTEYTRVEPFVFAHDRSRDNNYGSLGYVLGPRIGPNADEWYFRTDYVPQRNLAFSLRVHLVREGENIVDSTGLLAKNVGGSLFQPHRPSDSVEKKFLDGILMKTTRIEFFGSFEIINQWWLEGWYGFESIRNTTTGILEKNRSASARIRIEF